MTKSNFTSKSLAHIESYPLIKKTHDYVLSYHLLLALNTYFLATINFVNTNVVSKLPFLVNQLSFLDNKVDALVLANFDKILSAVQQRRAQISNLVASYKKRGTDFIDTHTKRARDIAGGYKKKGEDTIAPYLKPINDYATSAVDKVLPKIDDAAKKAEKKEKAAQNEIANTINIVNDTYARSKSLIHNKSSQVSNKVISTYNLEFTASEEKNYYVKVASASVKTGVSLLKSVKSEYLPNFEVIISSASDVAHQAQAKADEVISNGDTAFKNTVNSVVDGAKHSNIPVSTSA